jgi:hypothetical protein
MSDSAKFGTASGDPAHLGDMMSAIMRAQARMMDSFLKQNIETLDFMKQRFEQDRTVFNRLAESDDPAAALTVLQDFWNRSVKDYADEAGKLGALATVTADQFVEGLTDEALALAGGAARTGKG